MRKEFMGPVATLRERVIELQGRLAKARLDSIRLDEEKTQRDSEITDLDDEIRGTWAAISILEGENPVASKG